MNDNKAEYLTQLIELVEAQGLAGFGVYDDEGKIIGLIIGEDSFVELFTNGEMVSNKDELH